MTRLRKIAPYAFVMLSSACSTAEEAQLSAAAAFAADECYTSFEPMLSRAGEAGLSTLHYACEGAACSGREAFASHTTHSVFFDVASGDAASVMISSDTPEVLHVTQWGARFDPCVGQMRVFATLEAFAEGSVALEVHVDGVRVDRVEGHVAKAFEVQLRASTLAQFDFRDDGKAVQAVLGEPLLVAPSVRDAQGKLLVGVPRLSWHLDDERVASLRTEPDSEDEQYSRDLATPRAVFIDAKAPGKTELRVATRDGAEGTLSIVVMP